MDAVLAQIKATRCALHASAVRQERQLRRLLGVCLFCDEAGERKDDGSHYSRCPRHRQMDRVDHKRRRYHRD